ncbi:hypothetical protein CYMTET_33452 [Cymbomonas tetramitiformis]|uniref:GPI ethanolamine phosphate transferase 3 n=1 Tax=Cymbomonas tetramitiformis TaxID=36881 RepID=A0AAE0FD04_9CHLO|nr:hypothetical protein CYMTET_33452 [Cymbomonas tetramitiformis]
MKVKQGAISGVGTVSWLALLAIVTTLHLVALGIFAQGFLLSRIELPDASTCPDSIPRWMPQNDNSKDIGCWSSPAYNKVVILIVDALRWDFVTNHPNASAKSRDYKHLEALGALQHLRSVHPHSTALLKFIADPPTTTMQRLKGLLTGGLPTFVDIGNSFGAETMTEDNLIAQLKASHRRLAFSGDDTWMQLFSPETFQMSAPFPSLNVKDLDTVDIGVANNLLPALLHPEQWDVAIGHTLAVDHAGHIFGVDSPAMAAKLAETNALIEKVVQTMEGDSGVGGAYHNALLVVMGDHGQTMHGDHGGGSPEEVESVFFAYALGKEKERATMFPSFCADLASAQTAEWMCPECGGVMPQLDFAPTMAMLLGVPIPFGSVGRVSAAAWALAGDAPRRAAGVRPGSAGGEDAVEQANSRHMEWLRSYTDALRVNAWQVHRYLESYVDAGGSLGGSAAVDLDAMYHRNVLPYLSGQAQADSSMPDEGSAAGEGQRGDLMEQCVAYMQYLAAAAQLARSHWTQFSGPEMCAGIALLAATTAFSGLAAAALWRPHTQGNPGSLTEGSPHCTLEEALRRSAGGAAAGAALATCWGVWWGPGGPSRVAIALILGAAGCLAPLVCFFAGCTARDVHRVDPAGCGHQQQISADWGGWTMPTWAAGLVLVHAAGLMSSSMIDEEGAVAHFLIVTLALLYLRHALAGLRTSAADTPLRSTASTHQAPMDSPDGGSRPPIQEAVGRVHVAVGLILVAAALHRQVVPETQLKSMQAAAAGGDPSLSQSESPWTPAEGSSRGSGADLLGLRLPLQLIARTSAFSLVSAAADAATFKYGPLMLIANFLLRGGEAAPTRWMGRALKLLLTAEFLMVALYWAMIDFSAALPRHVWRGAAPEAIAARFPQMAYALAALAVCLVVLEAIFGRKAMCGERRSAPADALLGGKGGATVQEPAQIADVAAAKGLCTLDEATLAWRTRCVMGAVAGIVCLIVPPRGALVVLMCAAQASLSMRGVRHSASLSATCNPSWELWWQAVTWRMQAMQLFFASGHACRFNALHFSSAMIGFQEFHFLRQGALLALNTWAFDVLLVLALPLLGVAYGKRGPLSHSKVPEGVRSSDSCITATTDAGETTTIQMYKSVQNSQFLRRLWGMYLAGMFLRGLDTTVITVFVAMERRHLMVWARFAPKFAFEACGLLLNDVIILGSAGLLLFQLSMN